MTRPSLGSAGLKLLGVAIAIYVLSFYLRLGFLLPAVLGVGALVSLAATASVWRRARLAGAAAAGVVVAYLGIQAAVFSTLSTESIESRSMRWRVGASPPGARGPEVLLEFDDSPTHYIGLYSAQVAEHLRSSGGALVEVQFSVTRDLGCLRGFRETRIGTLEAWETTSGGYSGSAGATEPPWSDPWWCP